MAKAKKEGYLSSKESRRISRENRKITNEYEKKRKRRNVAETEYLTEMRDPKNAVEFDNLHTYFFTDAGTVKSVDGVSFEVPIGKTVGVVGESGCGKSVTSLSLMQLLQRPQGQIVDGSIRLNMGDKAYDIAKMPNEKMMAIRGNAIAASAVGINVNHYKLLVFAIVSAMGGLAGVLYAFNIRYIQAEAFTTNMSFKILTMGIIGGMGDLAGGVIGSLVAGALPEFLRDLSKYQLTIYGLLIVLVLRFMPRGIVYPFQIGLDKLEILIGKQVQKIKAKKNAGKGA